VKSDINGCSTCLPGEERYERFYSPILRDYRLQYDYRTPDGELFSCVGPTLEVCRERCRRWVAQRAAMRERTA
jgi:hypothetical protein